jgi:histidinol dehydrogenase
MPEPFTGLPVLDLREHDRVTQARWRTLCDRSFGLDGDADVAARAIVEQVRREGDAAIVS